MMVKHLGCWHICKGIEGGEKGDEVLPLVTLPPSCSMHCHPCGGDQSAVAEKKELAMAPLVTAYTAMCTSQGVSGATVIFNPRLVKLELEGKVHCPGHRHPCDGASPFFSKGWGNQ
jgi:hypothetical protein